MKFWKLRHGTFSVEDSSVLYLQKLQYIDGNCIYSFPALNSRGALMEARVTNPGLACFAWSQFQAMFAALEVAEIHEALEQSRANAEVTGPSPSKDAKGKKAGQKSAAKGEAKGHAKKKKASGAHGSKSDWWSHGWSDGWKNSDWWESDSKTTARWQKREDASEAAQRDR